MPALKLKPVEGTVGTEVTAIGAGFRPNISYRIQFQDQWLTPGTTNNRGAFMVTFKVPAVPYGDQDVTAVSQTAHQLAHARFRMLPCILQVEPADITLGETLTVRGAGFGSNEPVLVRLNERTVTLQPEPRTHADGTLTLMFAVTEEMVPPAPVTLAIVGKETGATAQTQQRVEVKLAS